MFKFACKKENIDNMNDEPRYHNNVITEIDPQVVKPDYFDEDIMILDNVKDIYNVDLVRLNMNIIAFCKSGKVQVMIGGTQVEIHMNQLFICPPDAALSNLMVSPDIDFTTICITNRAIQMLVRPYSDIWLQNVYFNKYVIRELSEINLMFFSRYYDLIRILIDYNDDTKTSLLQYKKKAIQSIIRGGLLGICSLFSNTEVENKQMKPQQEGIFNRFIELLQTEKVKHQRVKYFADKLCITPKYLSVICKKNSGKTANEWIREYTLSDIDYYLTSTNYSIKEIVHLMNFPNPSFFGKYVKMYFNMSPNEYRKSKNKS